MKITTLRSYVHPRPTWTGSKCSGSRTDEALLHGPFTMAHIDITRTHHLGLDEARRAAEEVAADLRTQYRARAEWHGDTLRLHGPGVKGALDVTPEIVRVTASLGLALRPLRRHLEREIEEHLDRYIAASR